MKVFDKAEDALLKVQAGVMARSVELRKNIMDSKQIVMIVYMVLMVCGTLFADQFGIQGRMETVLGILYSPWVKGILIFALALACMGIVMGRADEQMWKKLGAIGLGVALYLATPSIAKAIWKDGTSISENSLNN